MDDLQRAIKWLESEEQRVSQAMATDSIPKEFIFARAVHLKNCRALLDALRKEPCEYCDRIEALNPSWPIPTEVEFAEQIAFVDGHYRIALPKSTKTGGINYRFSEPIHNCPNCGRPLPAPPERGE